MQTGDPSSKIGFVKIRHTCLQAIQDTIAYAWVDTCCIDKTSSAELSEAINSMFRWYKEAETCYVYLTDVVGSVEEIESEKSSIRCQLTTKFTSSRWFTRGWTLQELIAPSNIKFYTRSWQEIGTRDVLYRAICRRTNIDYDALVPRIDIITGLPLSRAPLQTFCVARRMSWAADRVTSRIEDRAYSLLGIFEVNMPLLYGEGIAAFQRLQEEIIRRSTDQSIFAWTPAAGGIREDENDNHLLARTPSDFSDGYKIVENFAEHAPYPFNLTNAGLDIKLPVVKREGRPAERWFKEEYYLAVLNCRFEHDDRKYIAIRMTPDSPSSWLHKELDSFTPRYGANLNSQWTGTRNSERREAAFKKEVEKQRPRPIRIRKHYSRPNQIIKLERAHVFYFAFSHDANEVISDDITTWSRKPYKTSFKPVDALNVRFWNVEMTVRHNELRFADVSDVLSNIWDALLLHDGQFDRYIVLYLDNLYGNMEIGATVMTGRAKPQPYLYQTDSSVDFQYAKRFLGSEARYGFDKISRPYDRPVCRSRRQVTIIFSQFHRVIFSLRNRAVGIHHVVNSKGIQYPETPGGSTSAYDFMDGLVDT